MLNDHQWKEVEACKQASIEDSEGTCCSDCSIQYVCLAQDLAEHRAMLKRIEWAVIAQFGNDRRCPICLGLKSEGHKNNCELAALLRSGEENFECIKANR